MNKFLKYFKIQVMRSVKHYPMIWGLTLVLTASILLFANRMFHTDDAENSKKKIQIGLVGDLTETYLDIGIVALTDMDSSRYYVDLVELPEEEAKQKLASGELYGYISIPEGFVESIVYGENKPLTYVAANSPATLGPVMVNEILEIVSQLVVQGQNGIYGMLEIAEEYQVSDKVTDRAIVDLNVRFVDTVLDREQFYELEYVGLGEGISYTNYYICAFFVLLLLLWGMAGSSLLIKRDMSLQRVLHSRGHCVIGLVLGDYLAFALIMLFNMALLLGVGSFFLKLESVPTFFALLPVVLLVTSMQFLLYELTDNYISGVFVQLFTAIACSYISGFFYPIYSLPEVFQKFSRVLPTGVAFGYLKEMVKGNSGEEALGAAWMYVLVFVTASVAMRIYKMRSNKYD